MTDKDGTVGSRRARPGRRALFSDPGAGPVGPPPAGGDSGLRSGRQALFSEPSPPAATEPGPAPDRSTAVVHCRTCLASTRLPLVRLGAALVPSLWLPTRPWPRLMRCPACRRVSWCRIEWPRVL